MLLLHTFAKKKFECFGFAFDFLTNSEFLAELHMPREHCIVNMHYYIITYKRTHTVKVILQKSEILLFCR